MEKQERAEQVIVRMNQLWKTYRQRPDQTTMNEFVKCQQWLSNRDIPYYQDKVSGQWKLGIRPTQ